MFLTLVRFLGQQDSGKRTWEETSMWSCSLGSSKVPAPPNVSHPTPPDAVGHRRVPWVSPTVSQKTPVTKGQPSALLIPGMGHRDSPGNFCSFVCFGQG